MTDRPAAVGMASKQLHSADGRPARARKPGGLRLRNGITVRYPAVMGVLNVTPDSFSDGGQYLDLANACKHALQMEAEGAGIIDIGGESTRPGAREVPVAEECRRVLPVIEMLAGQLRLPISIDTRKAEVARAALAAGAAIVNDVSGLTCDPGMLPLVAKTGAAVVIMHSRVATDIANRDGRYRDVVAEVTGFLRDQAVLAVNAGVARSHIILDPGLGFAKGARYNLEILVGFERLSALGYPVLIGASRKRFVRRIAGPGAEGVSFGNAAVNAWAVAAGASIVRVHEVAPAVAVARMITAIIAGGRA